MRVTTVTGQVAEGFRHEGRTQTVVLGNRFYHVLEEHVLVRSSQRVVVIPVHLELAVGVLVVILVGIPAKLEHAIADFADDRVLAHQRLLIVAGLALRIGGVGNLGAIGADQVILALDAGFHAVAFFQCLRELTLERDPRRRFDFLAIHPQVRRDPADLGLPRQLNEAIGIRDCEQVRMRRRHVQPGCEAGETGAVLLHALDGARRYQLGAQHAEQVDPAHQEVFDFFGFSDCLEIFGHIFVLQSGM